MAATRYCPSCLSPTTFSARLNTRTSFARSPFLPSFPLRARDQIRAATTGKRSENAAKYRRKDQPGAQNKKKARTTFKTPDLKEALQFSLVDAMRYLRAVEVGRAPTSSKYELHVRFRTPKNGAAVRSRIRLPHPVKTDLRICVIAAPDSVTARQAQENGATVVGEETVFEAVRAGTIDFDRCLCHQDSVQKLNKAGIARILGPRGLMPSVKTGTVVKDVRSALREMVGASEYRERLGVVRLAIGQLGFTPDEVSRNVRAFIARLKFDLGALSDRTHKEIHEVVLSSTNGPGLSLNGELRGTDSLPSKDLTTL